MKSTQARDENKAITVADLCEALSDGRLASQRNGEYYVVRKNDLRRFVDDYEPLLRTLNIPTISRIVAAG